MSAVNVFIAETIKGFLIVLGPATCGTLPFAIDIKEGLHPGAIVIGRRLPARSGGQQGLEQ